MAARSFRELKIPVLNGRQPLSVCPAQAFYSQVLMGIFVLGGLVYLRYGGLRLYGF